MCRVSLILHCLFVHLCLGCAVTLIEASDHRDRRLLLNATTSFLAHHAQKGTPTYYGDKSRVLKTPTATSGSESPKADNCDFADEEAQTLHTNYVSKLVTAFAQKIRSAANSINYSEEMYGLIGEEPMFAQTEHDAPSTCEPDTTDLISQIEEALSPVSAPSCMQTYPTFAPRTSHPIAIPKGKKKRP